jgi:ligand-binding SRPBCC domain-containing protein
MMPAIDGSTSIRVRSACAEISFARRGRHHVLSSRQWVAAGPDASFSFFSNAANLEAITPPFLRFRILTPLPVTMRTGTLIEYRLSLLGLSLPWLTRIEDWRAGRSFTDVQLRGPYARWIHRHRFAPEGGGTWVRDEVEYVLPLAPLSEPVHALFVRPRLREIFTFRQRAIAQRLGG